MNQLCVPHFVDSLLLIKEAHAFACGGHCGTTKTTLNMSRHFFWPSMSRQVERFIHSCTLCSHSNPSNHKHGLYQPLFPLDHANRFPWTSWAAYRSPNASTMHFGSSFSIFPRWPCLFLLIRLPLPLKPQNSFSIMFGHTLGFHKASSRIEIPDSLVPFSTHFGVCWVTLLNYQPRSIRKWIEKSKLLTVS